MSPQTIEMHFAQIMQVAESLTDLSKSLRALGEQELLQAVRENRAWDLRNHRVSGRFLGTGVLPADRKFGGFLPDGGGG